ncbi:MAG: pyridoxamine 5'-phosphate oxidase family protein [Desulfosalsimonas sp.]|uniref:pyridoxamine 5'-phosphate oxidase family protein n=1 Tax=Desulfosalsimonas sp. TaxID=3073848 RepID=UPI00397089F5
MREDIQSLLRAGRHCVMATAADNKPYCSLMAYVVNDDYTRIFMGTRRNTRKYQNLAENPLVSLLMDSRDQHQPQALTIEGVIEEIDQKPEKDQIREALVSRHPELKSLLDSPDAAIISVRVKSVVFLNGLTDVFRQQIE